MRRRVVQPTESTPRSSPSHSIGTASTLRRPLAAGMSGRVDVARVVVADERPAGLEHVAGGALAGADVHAVPALGDAVAGGRDRALLGVAEIDAGALGVERERGLVDEREQDLLQVERGVERAGGADDRAVLDRAGGAALVGLEAGEAGGGLVGGELGDARRRRA